MTSPSPPKPLLLAIATLLTAVLTCSRGDVPLPAGGIGSGAPSVEIGASDSLPLTSITTVAPRPSPADTATPDAPEPLVTPTFPPTLALGPTGSSETVLYEAQPGDMLRAVAVRFGVLPSDISSPDGPLASEFALIDPGRLLLIPRRLTATGPSTKLIPDSELVFSPHAADFDIGAFVEEKGGYLARFEEWISGSWRSGAEVVERAARDHSVNPRLLLALIEYHTGWVTDPSTPPKEELTYPLGYHDPQTQGLFRQLAWLSNELGNGYYGWRVGRFTQLTLADGSIVRVAPDLNAGTVALQYYFALFTSGREWAAAIDETGFIATYKRLFGDPFDYTHPLFEIGLEQPDLILPFLPGHVWAFTGGPHGAWERESAWAALDFAPGSVEHGCVESDEWVVASAPGLVVRSENGVVILDLDGDGREQTGWSLLYLHIAEKGRVEVGTLVEQGDLLGHPSCEGGFATGTHVHFARKYNGEWMLADGPVSFNLEGWIAVAGTNPYQGALVRGNQVILACRCASRQTYISR